jgi:cytochrome c-type biogenesis protein CcmH
MTRKILISIAAVLLFGFLVVKLAAAQQPTPSDDQVNAIARQLFCPVCENIPLDVCPTTACAQWRELIRQKLADGWNEQQIKNYFVEQYGARVLGTPPAKGINWLVYIVPPLIFITGIYILFRSFRSWKRSNSQVPTTSATPIEPGNGKGAQDAYLKKLEDEVRKR